MIESDCCGVVMSDIKADYGICPRCGEHCESVESRENGDSCPT